MPEYIPFAGNCIDRSNSFGFQWEFFCWRCGNGYMSSVQVASNAGANVGGIAAKKAASFIPIVGDFLGDAASDAMGDKAKDAALQRAIAEVAPVFAQCPQCSRWRCRAHCWNSQVGRCLDCASLQQPAYSMSTSAPASAPSPTAAQAPYYPPAIQPPPAYPATAYPAPPSVPLAAPQPVYGASPFATSAAAGAPAQALPQPAMPMAAVGAWPVPPPAYLAAPAAGYAPYPPYPPYPQAAMPMPAAAPYRPATPPAGRTILTIGLVLGIIPALFGLVVGLAIPSHVDTYQCTSYCADPAQPVIVVAMFAASVFDPIAYAVAGWRAAKLLGRVGAGVQAAMLASAVGTLIGGTSIVVGIHTLEMRLYPLGASNVTSEAAGAMVGSLVGGLFVSAFFGWLGALGGRRAFGRR